ncbi:unnamed protein product [Caretta caretta]
MGQLEREVFELERRLAASPEDPSLCGACREKREELRALEDHRARGAFVRSRIRLLREMDRGSRFFYALEKKRGAKKHITCLLAEDGTPSRIRVLWDGLPTVSAGDRDRLELPLTLAEFSEALRRMPTNKSPGMDGLTVEFYRAFWDVLGPDLVTVWAESLQGGVLPLSCRRAVLALLPKKGDLRDLRNWRPLSLLSTDYKVVAKAISLRLGSVLADVIHPDQTYTVPGRTIFDNLYLVRDLLELGCRDGLSFALLSLDQEKAFDRVDHGYLLGTLRAFGLGPQFVGFLQVLYASAECLVRLNWTLTEPVSFGRGVRQGCPLSGQLYALAIEPFLCLLRRRLTGLALREPELRLETHTDPAAEASWRLEWGDRVYFSHLTIRTAGVATLFSPDLRPEVLGVAEAVPGRLLHLRVRLEGLVVNLVNIYAPTSGPERLRFFQRASAFLGTLDPHECLVLGGDFNTTLEERDRSGTEQCPAAADVLREIVDHHSLVDVWRDHHPDDTSTFTFVRVEARRARHSRLDRIYLSRFHLSQAHSSSIRPAPFSDHHLATVTVSLCAEKPGPAYWHFNNSLLEDVGFVASFREFWLAWRGQRRAFPSARRWWDLGKVRARLFCRDYTRGASRRRDAAMGQLEREVFELERRLAASPEDPSLCGACREKREELRALEDHRARGAFVRSRIRLLREMDRGSRFFYALEKKRGAKKHITCLLAEDGTPSRIRWRCAGGPGPSTQTFSPRVRPILPLAECSGTDSRRSARATETGWSCLSPWPSSREALRRMPTNKSPGMDGLTVEFYRAFWDVLGPDLVTVWAESLQGGVLPLSCRRAVLALLPKKGDLRDLRNWRPLSLLSTDYKVVAKAISLRLGSVLADVIHPDQTYTVPGRTIFDNLYLVRDLLELGCRDGLSFALLSLDQEKAFDRVDHGRLTGLALREPELRLVLSAYADDVLLVVQDPGDLARVEACQAVYSAASSARVNWVKSSGLVETHTDPAAEASWRLEWGDRVYFSHLTIRTAGVATLFSPDLRPEVLGVAEAVPGRLLHLRVRLEGLVVNLVNIYAPTSGPERLRFFQRASAFLGTLDPHECLVLGGDFNTTLEERDRSGTEQCPAAADVLREIVDHHSLVDVWRDHHPDDTSTFTFVRVEARRARHSRLDRIYLSRFHLSQAHSSSIRPAPFSDHHLATVTVSLCAEKPGPAYWHFNNSLLEDVGFVASFREFWLAWRGQRRAFPSARRWWDLGKVRARLFCRDYTRGASRRRDAVMGQLEREVFELERRLAASPEDPSLCGACREKREELRALEDHRARGAFVRSRIRLLREMDRGSRFFYALEKKRGAKKHITCLLAEDGTPLTDPVEMCGRARAFYADLFSPGPTDPAACRVLWDGLPTVSAGDRDRLELPLTLAEFSEALRRMPTNKSPGMDGLTVEFYRAFWDVLGPDLVTVWAESLQGGVLPLSCRRAVLALVPKKGDLRDFWNWRPLSLLSTDYKVVAKAISLRLGSVLADVIHPDQTYTVPGRTIFDNLYLVRDLLELGCRDGLSFALLSLDQEKAFDRVDHGYLLGTLRAFGLGPQFVGFLQVLYASAECLVRLNWTLAEPVSFGRGVRQGCPLSGQLYALAIEPFLCLLRRRLTGLALREPELRLVLSAYADDVLLVVQDPGDLARVEACQAVYSAASCARVNWVKSSGLVETHTDPAAEASWRLEWGDRVYFSHLTGRTAGVATLFSPDLRPEVLGVAEAVPGRLLHLRVRLEGLVVNLVNIYAPTSGPERLRFFQRASAFLGTLDPHECLVLGGDFNTTLEERDRSGDRAVPGRRGRPPGDS